LIIYLIKMNESGYVRYPRTGAQPEHYRCGLLLGSFIISLILGVATHGPGFVLFIPLLAVILIGQLVFLILAAVASNRGELYRVPNAFCLPLVH
jgi:uncharacterized Tic20 family protein